MHQEIGMRIRALRKRRKWTILELSQKTGIGRAMLGFIERGDRRATTENIHALAEAFNVKPGLLIDPELPLEDLEDLSLIASSLRHLDDQQRRLLLDMISTWQSSRE